jgi:hypothetical protein
MWTAAAREARRRFGQIDIVRMLRPLSMRELTFERMDK